MLGQRRPETDERLEWAALEREHEGLMHQVRLEGLGTRLQRVASMAVTHCTRGLCGDRVSMWLDDGSKLRVRLFYSVHGTVAALCGVVWRDDIGWVVDVRTTNGEARRLYAWYARLDFPAA